MRLDVLNARGEKKGSIELNDSVFNAPVHDDCIYRAVTAELANRRTGTAFFKNRDLMSMTTKKMYKQKGTGNARHGSMSANLFVGGGQAFGGQRHNYKKKIAPVIKYKALLSLLSLKVKENKLKIVESFGVKDGKTKEAAALVNGLAAGPAVALCIVDPADILLKRAVANLSGVRTAPFDRLCSLDLYSTDTVLLDSATAKKLNDRLSRA